MTTIYVWQRRMPIGGMVALLSDQGHRHWPADHCAAICRQDADITAVAIADGVGDDHEAVTCARIAAVVTATAAAHTAIAPAGILAARSAVTEYYRPAPALQRSVSTIVTAVITQAGIELAWAGDSVAYALYDSGAIEALTEPHHPLSPEPCNIADGAIRTRYLRFPTEEQAGEGSADDASVRRLLLCSDGLTDALDEQDIAQLLMIEEPPPWVCRQLVDAALRGGSRDNITVALADMPPRLPARAPLA